MNLKKLLKFLLPTLNIPTVSRLSLDRELKRQFKRLEPGVLLDVGSKLSPYSKYIPHTKYLRLDIDEKSSPDICCDIGNVKWESDYFDTVLATEVLEHLLEPQKAVDEIKRLLKPGGICILSTRFMYPYHPDPVDCYRFTQDSLKFIFKGFSKVEIFHHGNRVQVLWETINRGKIRAILNIFNYLFALVHFKKTEFPCGFVVYARK